MPGIGTIVNAGTVFVCALLGLAVKKGIPKRFNDTIFCGLGASVFIMGISGAMAGILRAKPDGLIDRADILLMIISLAVGGVAGELLRIDVALVRVSMYFQKIFIKKDGDNKFAEGFITTTVLFCAGAMAIVGSIEDGLMRNPDTLFAKSIIDGVSAFLFASAYGAGVLLTAISLFVYQGAISLLSGFLSSVITEAVLLQMSLVGSVIIALIGIDMLKIKKINVANFIPATFVPLIYSLILRLFY